MTIKVVELFAGVGGFRLGLEQASNNFKTVWANQWEPGKKAQYAFDCYNYHYGKKGGVNEWSNVDINIAKDYCPDCDLLVGGFPCQDYSVASTNAKGIKGKKGVLWWDIRDILEKKRPSYVLLENVDRLLKSPASQRGRDFGIILKSMNDLGYAVEWRVINAADYGCAQRRRRTFIFGYHKSTKFYQKVINNNLIDIVLKKGFFYNVFKSTMNKDKEEIEFDFINYKNLASVSKKFKTIFRNAGICVNGKGISIDVNPELIPPVPLSKIVEKGKVDSTFYLNRKEIRKIKYMRGSKKIERRKPNGDIYYYSEGAMSPYDDLRLPSRTMLTSEGTMNRSTHIIKDRTGRLRKLTQKECERLNHFPDNWTNTGMPPKFRYFCMGNALVVKLITLMGKKINIINK